MEKTFNKSIIYFSLLKILIQRVRFCSRLLYCRFLSGFRYYSTSISKRHKKAVFAAVCVLTVTPKRRSRSLCLINQGSCFDCLRASNSKVPLIWAIIIHLYHALLTRGQKQCFSPNYSLKKLIIQEEKINYMNLISIVYILIPDAMNTIILSRCENQLQ